MSVPAARPAERLLKGAHSTTSLDRLPSEVSLQSANRFENTIPDRLCLSRAPTPISPVIGRMVSSSAPRPFNQMIQVDNSRLRFKTRPWNVRAASHSGVRLIVPCRPRLIGAAGLRG
jgi:hypothetical protein